MLKELKEFALRGSVLDMAIGVIIGVSFGRIVTSLVNDVLMPPLGLLTGKIDFGSLFVNLGDTAYDSLAAAEEAGAAVIKYGAFINTVVHFVIVALAVYLVVKAVNAARREVDRQAAAAEEPAPEPVEEPATKKCRRCLFDIPDEATRCGYCTTDV